MRKFLFLALAILLVVSQVALASFSDVSTGDDYEVAISWMSDNGVIEGYPDGTFGPDICVNRVEMLKLLFEMMEVDVSGATGDLFSDTPEGQWYEQYLRAGRDRGTVEGYPDGTFKPAQCVNRVEAMKMAVLEFNGGDLPVAQDQPDMPYDIDDTAWYYGYLEYSMYADIAGLLHIDQGDYGFNFYPGDDMTRKEVSEMLYRMKAVQDNNIDVYAVGNTPDPIISNTLSVTFSDITLLDNDVVMADYKDDILDIYNVSMTYTWADIDDLFKWYEVGVINGAPYDGWKLTVLDNACDGMCISNYIYRFAFNESTGELVLLDNHTTSNYTPDYIAPLEEGKDTSTTFSALLMPETIVGPDNSTFNLVTIDSWYLNMENLTEVAFTNPVVGNLYYSGDGESIGCVFAKSKDGAIHTYEYSMPLVEDENVVVSLNDGGEFSADDYALTTGGCGLAGTCYFVRGIEESDFTLMGTSSNGIDVYAVSDPYEGAVDDTNANEAQIEFEQTYITHLSQYQWREDLIGITPPSFEEFIDEYPILYWQDPLGRWSSLTQSYYMPPVECGKPVIYLYPEDAIDVHVEVEIDEFTVTIPEYGKDGWTVNAQPDGTLYNYADGQEYPYLFWEGHKKDGLTTDSGFMVSRDELDEFFNSSLAEMGLNEQEKADFMEFWVPRMLDNSEEYFFISFIGTRDFNKVAPLTIDPKPDTLIRVFMYYHPTHRPFDVMEQKLSTIPRNGFTVIEWGGTSSKPWRR